MSYRTEHGAEAAQMYTAGYSLRQIGKAHGVDHSAVRHTLRRMRVKMRPHNGRPVAGKTDQVAALLCAGIIDRKELAANMGLSVWGIAYHETRLGAPSRHSPNFAVWVERLAREAA